MPDPAGPWGAGDRFPPTRRSVVLDRARRLGRRHRAAILLVLAYVLMRVLLILILGR